MAEEVANARAIRDWANDKFAEKGDSGNVPTITGERNG